MGYTIMVMDENMISTPSFIISKAELDENYNGLFHALQKYWPNSIIGYSYKTNSLPWIVAYFRDHGCFAEVVSQEEYELGKQIGVKADHFIYNGPIKTRETFYEALANGCYVNIDSQREIEWLTDLPAGEYRIGLRVNFDLEQYCPTESQCGDEGGRFGFCLENGELTEAICKVRQLGIEPAGLHLHVSSKTRSIKIYQTIAAMAVQIAKDFQLNLQFVDIGGGFFGGMPNKPQFDDYLSRIAGELSNWFHPSKTTLMVEPGISLIGSPISYVTSVIDVKETTYNRFIITDGSRIHIDPLMRKRSYLYEISCRDHMPMAEKQVICGCTCMENDRLFTLMQHPRLQVGDRIIYKKVGAYTMCLSPLFIKYFPDVYLRNKETLSCVRRAWGISEYLQKSAFEPI